MFQKLKLCCELAGLKLDKSSLNGMFGLGGELHCRLWKSEILLWTGLMCSTYNLLAVSVERFLEVSGHLIDKKNYYLCVTKWHFDIILQTGRDSILYFYITVPFLIIFGRHKSFFLG